MQTHLAVVGGTVTILRFIDSLHLAITGGNVRIRSRWLTKVAVWCILLGLRMLYATCRRKYVAIEPDTNAYNDLGTTRHLYCVWHDQIAMVLFTGRPKNSAGLVSKHQDGTYVADVMRMRGIVPVRGSTNRGAAKALRQLMDAIKNYHVTITPDGPRGPRHELKPGIVFLASQSGRRIAPTAFACRRSWSIKGSWTDMMLPKPFTRVYAFVGTSLEVPANASREELIEYQAKLQLLMEDCERKVQRLAAGESIESILSESEEPVEQLKRAA